MTDYEYIRKQREDTPVLAICYDFDKTLSPDDMQAQGYIQSIDYDVSEFWHRADMLSQENEMDSNLAYMYMMVDGARGKILFNKNTLMEYGSKVKLFPGVEGWFERIRSYGEEHGVIVEHYIISSGLKEMIEGTSVAEAGAFEKIYASSFMFDERDVPVWPAQVINYTNKTQFLFRIEKGVLDVNDSGVNDYFPPEDIRVPFRNMIYIGDSDTDIPCMKLVNTYGGHSIGVYNNDTLDKTKVYKMLHDKRIKYFAPADYTENSKLDKLVKLIVERTATNEVLENEYFECKEEQEQNDLEKKSRDEKRRRLSLITSLSGSGSFATTHAVVKELSIVDKWETDEIGMLLDIALNNNQVNLILTDSDVKSFYQFIIKQIGVSTDKSKKVERLIRDASIINT